MHCCGPGQISLTNSPTGIWGLHFSFPNRRQKLPSISALLNLADKLTKNPLSLLGTYFTSCKGWKRPSAEIAKKTQIQPPPPLPSLQTHSSLKHYQGSPTVGSYRPRCPRLAQKEIKLRGFNTAGRNWMSEFPPGGCVTNAAVNRESEMGFHMPEPSWSPEQRAGRSHVACPPWSRR